MLKPKKITAQIYDQTRHLFAFLYSFSFINSISDSIWEATSTGRFYYLAVVKTSSPFLY